MRMGKNVPGWKHLVQSWKQQQQELNARVRVEPLSPLPRFVAGADAAFSRDKTTVFAAAVVYDRQEQRVVEVRHASAPAAVPYIPTFLSFREGEAVLKAVSALKSDYGVICFDGQGLAHPRRCGLATHLGVMLDRPAIGCAKSRLIGEFIEPDFKAGSSSALIDQGETIGAVLRTRDGVKPIFVSVGHRVDLPSAIALLMQCTRHRIPEPTRQADREVGMHKARGI